MSRNSFVEKISCREVFLRNLKMVKRRDFLICGVFTYIILIILFFVLMEKPVSRQVCNYHNLCVRFCCNDTSTCKDIFIRKNFNSSILTTLGNDNETNTEPEYKILYGQPSCSLEFIGSEKNWDFHSVSFRFNI